MPSVACLAWACVGLSLAASCDEGRAATVGAATAPSPEDGRPGAPAAAGQVTTGELSLTRTGTGCLLVAGATRVEVTLAPLTAVERGAEVVAWTSRATSAGPLELRRDDRRAFMIAEPPEGGVHVLDPQGVAVARLNPGSRPEAARIVDGAGALVGVVAATSVTATRSATVAGQTATATATGAAATLLDPTGAELGAAHGTAEPMLAALLLAPGLPPAVRALLGCQRLAAASSP